MKIDMKLFCDPSQLVQLLIERLDEALPKNCGECRYLVAHYCHHPITLKTDARNSRSFTNFDSLPEKCPLNRTIGADE